MTYPTPLTTTVSNPRLRLLNKLKAGEFPLMTFMAIPSIRMAQIVALTYVPSELARAMDNANFSLEVSMVLS